MKPTNNLGSSLRSFFCDYQPRQCNASPNTVWAYRDSLRQLLCHAASSKKCSVAELELGDLGHKMVLTFLESIETKQGNSPEVILFNPNPFLQIQANNLVRSVNWK